MIQNIIIENHKRIKQLQGDFNPLTGENAPGERTLIHIPDFPITNIHLPNTATEEPLIKLILKHRSISQFIEKHLKQTPTNENHNKVSEAIVRLRAKHDFPFWAYLFATIKNKDGGDDIHFKLNAPQRLFVNTVEQQRLNQQPIRIVLLKARQWGGSTVTQLYMAWLQLMHSTGLNSLIIAHQAAASDEINDMFSRLMDNYPTFMLHQQGEAYEPNEQKLIGVGKSGTIRKIPQRGCKIKVGTAKSPDSSRGGDYALVHCSEIGIWEKTQGRRPEDIIRAATSGVLFKPLTMIVYESTAKGTGNFFHTEYQDAKRGRSQFKHLFIPWFSIERYTLPFNNEEEEAAFAKTLLEQKDITEPTDNRHQSGRYLYYLWEKGATLQAIKWYIAEREKFSDTVQMASEYPTDDVEAFANTGTNVFDRYLVEKFRASCRAPKFVGELQANAEQGDKAFHNLKFKKDKQGKLLIWAMPEENTAEEIVTDRYLTVVDIGAGITDKADYSVIVVFDRLFMADGYGPVVVAQWRGHCDMDILSWKATQIAHFYNKALLVIESNTLDTKSPSLAAGDPSLFILSLIKDAYPNLYARTPSPDQVKEGIPVRYGFHTNRATKRMIIEHLKKIIREHLYTERDDNCVDEMLQYEQNERGAYAAPQGLHDDLLMTRAIGLYIAFQEMPIPRIIQRTITSTKHKQRKHTITEATI